MSYCEWAYVTCSLTTGRVTVLDLASNGFGRLSPLIAGLSELDEVTLDLNGLSVVPDLSRLGRLRRLTAFSNRIVRMEGLPDSLEVLKVDGNELVELPDPLPASLVELWCGGNRLVALPRSGLPAGLLVLNAPRNAIAGTLPALPRGLRSLVVGGNNLVALPAALPDSLVTLSAYANRIEAAPASLPRGLVELHLFSNNITELADGMFSGLTSLAVVDCSLNRIARVPASLLASPAATLETLDLSGNRITAFPRLASAPRLKKLALSDNLIGDPVQDVMLFAGPRMPKLAFLDLSRNPMGGSLSAEALSGDSKDLSVQAAVFKGKFSSLEVVKLNAVNISGEVYFDIFDKLWPSVTELDIRNNPLLANIPLRQTGSVSLVDARGCLGITDFLVRWIREADADKRIKRLSSLVTRTFNGKFSECDSVVEAGSMMRFSLRVDPEQHRYSSEFCTCAPGYVGDPQLDGRCQSCATLTDGNSIACSGGAATGAGVWFHPSNNGKDLAAVPCFGRDGSHCASASARRLPPNFVPVPGSFTCKEGYEGRLCSKCAMGYFSLGLSCKQCARATWVYSPIVTMVSYAVIGFKQLRRTTRAPTGLARIIILHLQLGSSLLEIITLQLPAAMQVAASMADSGTSLELSAIECLTGSRVVDQFTRPLVTALIFPLFAMFMAAAIAVPFRKRKGFWDAFFKAALFFWLVGCLLAVKKLAGTLSCTDFATGGVGGKYVSMNLWMSCDYRDKAYRGVSLVAIAVLLLFSVITGAVFFHLLLREPKNPDSTHHHLKAMLEGPYRPGHAKWELRQTVRKWAFALLQGLSPRGSPVMNIGFVIILTLSIMQQAWCRPYRHRVANYAETGSLLVLLISYLGWFLISRGASTIEVWVSYLILTVNLLFLLALIGIFLQLNIMARLQKARAGSVEAAAVLPGLEAAAVLPGGDDTDGHQEEEEEDEDEELEMRSEENGDWTILSFDTYNNDTIYSVSDKGASDKDWASDRFSDDQSLSF